MSVFKLSLKFTKHAKNITEQDILKNVSIINSSHSNQP